ncbi:hypothetical protein ENUP19_0271G0009 [Entamoeba nuttalli]|uniref:Uncharacterized protein n=2 Tax=Entamoeba nuttalli TaxID=412467 RepID=K2GTN2_ENTNP|nr:hypothetical protein ENU1_167000 [Entamoeba nuttalli P19]EKE38418.1 hypothetical protein ENU1_167000 [Entamoeba nuttalli P19]|eukprot:XP_008859245.1 hypothetical protein ENU1_167000 [Entamoeba nuttalli P19]
MNVPQFSSPFFSPCYTTSTYPLNVDSKQSSCNFFSVPTQVCSTLQTNCLCHQEQETFSGSMNQISETPMEEDYSFNDEVFDLEDCDEFTEDTSDSVDALASQLLETIENIKRQSQETNKILQNIMNMNKPK